MSEPVSSGHAGSSSRSGGSSPTRSMCARVSSCPSLHPCKWCSTTSPSATSPGSSRSPWSPAESNSASGKSCEQWAASELTGWCVPSWRRPGRSRLSLSAPFAQSTWWSTPAQAPASWRSSWPTTSSPKSSSRTSISAVWRNSRRPRRWLGGRRSVARRVRVLRDHLLDLGRRPWPPSVRASCAARRRVGPAQSSSCPSEFRSSVISTAGRQ